MNLAIPLAPAGLAFALSPGAALPILKKIEEAKDHAIIGRVEAPNPSFSDDTVRSGAQARWDAIQKGSKEFVAKGGK